MAAGPPRILIVKLGALGDVLMALPAARLLRASLPGVALSWLVEERNAVAVRASADIDRVHVVATHRWRRRPWTGATRREVLAAVADLRRERPSVALDLQGLVKSAVWARLSGAPVRIGLPPARTRERVSGVFLNRRSTEPQAGCHVTDLSLQAARLAVAALGGQVVESTEPEFQVAAAARSWVDRTLGSSSARYLVLNPGAAWVTKQWGAERFGALAAALVEQTGLEVVVTCGPAEGELARQVVEFAGCDGVRVVHSDLEQLAGLLEGARLVVSGDTGPYHLARTVGAPTVGLFGPTHPGWNGPRSPRDRFLWGQVPCSPCYRRRCPTQLECMDSLSVAAVAAVCREQLAG